MLPEQSKPEGWALVYLRPDGWWMAGSGWDSVEDAREDGRAHAWRGTSWAIVAADVLYRDEEEDAWRLPRDIEPTPEAVES